MSRSGPVPVAGFGFHGRIGSWDPGTLTDRAIYNDAAAQGLSIFNVLGKRAEQLREDWMALLNDIDRMG